MRRAVFAVVVLAGAVCALAPAVSSGQGRPLRLVLASNISYTWLPFLVAQNLTFDELSKEVGARVETTYAPQGNAAVLALLAGEQDFAIAFLNHAIKAQAEGKDVVALVSLMDSAASTFLVRADLTEVRSPRDMKGRVFGVLALGSGNHMTGLAIARANGLGADDITWRSLGTIGGWIPALRSKRVDFILAGEPTVSKAIDDGIGRMLLDLHSQEESERVFGGPYTTVVVLARREYVEAHPHLAQAVVDAHLRTLRWLRGRPVTEIVPKLPESLQKPPNVEAILSRVAPGVSRTGEVKAQAVTTLGEWMRRIGELPAEFRLDPAKVADPRFVQRSKVPQAR